MLGKSTYFICCNILAPSITAASFSSLLEFAKAAVYNIEAQPAPCHIPDTIYILLKASGIAIKFILLFIILLTGPTGDNKRNNIPHKTITDIKFGAYKINCIFFLILSLAIKFKTNAKIIGKGNPHNKPYILSFNVFNKYSIKSGEDKNLLKCSNPTHSLPIIPCIGL